MSTKNSYGSYWELNEKYEYIKFSNYLKKFNKMSKQENPSYNNLTGYKPY